MKKYPFKFLDAYEKDDTDIFFGRINEIDDLYEMIFQNSILLVYGASGTGKTSLIQCGLAGRFKSYNWLPLIIRRGNNINESLKKTLIDFAGKVDIKDDDDTFIDDGKLPETARLIRNVNLNHFKPIYLIFDQFEELYILSKDPEEEKELIKSVKEILLCKQPVKLIFSIREEYLGYLNKFEKDVPQLFRKKLRVELMSDDKISKVLQDINDYVDSNVHIESEHLLEISEKIINKLKGKKKNENIQLPYFQVFMDKLYMEITGDEKKEKEATITLEAVDKMGDIDDVLRDFLERQVKIISQNVSANSKLILPEILWKILLPFSTLKGTKEPLLINELLGKDELGNLDEVLVRKCIDEFVTARILNKSENTGRYELAHDSLAKCIAEKRTDEEIALVEIHRMFDYKLMLKEEDREPFNEKELNVIAPYWERLTLKPEEDKIYKESQRAVRRQKNKNRNRYIFILVALFVGASIMLILAIRANREEAKAKLATNKADSANIQATNRLIDFQKAQAAKDSIQFNELAARANTILAVGGRPVEILNNMKDIYEIYCDTIPAMRWIKPNIESIQYISDSLGKASQLKGKK